MHAYMHTCIHTYINACIHACLHACMHAYIHRGRERKRQRCPYAHTFIYITSIQIIISSIYVYLEAYVYIAEAGAIEFVAASLQAFPENEPWHRPGYRCRRIHAHTHTHIYIYICMVAPPIDPYFWRLQPTQAGFPQHLMRNLVSGFKDTLPLSAIPGAGPLYMSMPHLNFLDIWGSSFKSFKKVSNLKLNLKSKIEDSSKTFPTIFNLQSLI